MNKNAKVGRVLSEEDVDGMRRLRDECGWGVQQIAEVMGMGVERVVEVIGGRDGDVGVNKMAGGMAAVLRGMILRGELSGSESPDNGEGKGE